MLRIYCSVSDVNNLCLQVKTNYCHDDVAVLHAHALIEFVQTRGFISLNEIGVAAPSSSTTTRPGLTAVPSGGVTTMPSVLLCLLPAAEVSKMAVTALPGGGVGAFEFTQFRHCSCGAHALCGLRMQTSMVILL